MAMKSPLDDDLRALERTRQKRLILREMALVAGVSYLWLVGAVCTNIFAAGTLQALLNWLVVVPGAVLIFCLWMGIFIEIYESGL